MKTSSFHYTGPGRIAICRSTPRTMPGGYHVFTRLAPGPWFNSVSYAEYQKRYATEILALLDPQQTLENLTKLAAGAEPVLLCWEKPHDLASGRHYCHRRAVARWFRDKLSLDVPELGFETHDIDAIELNRFAAQTLL